jgi:hypothetical protein
MYLGDSEPICFKLRRRKSMPQEHQTARPRQGDDHESEPLSPEERDGGDSPLGIRFPPEASRTLIRRSPSSRSLTGGSLCRPCSFGSWLRHPCSPHRHPVGVSAYPQVTGRFPCPVELVRMGVEKEPAPVQLGEWHPTAAPASLAAAPCAAISTSLEGVRVPLRHVPACLTAPRAWV